ncbi:MAG TPA: polysaccharide deacetylase family protein [Terriglobales bacterium]|nr:polysaccharide deacetylase family protein [Terriglobales bacterium]
MRAWRSRLAAGRLVVIAIACLGVGAPAATATSSAGSATSVPPAAVADVPREAVGARLLDQLRLSGVVRAGPHELPGGGGRLPGSSRARDAGPEVRLAQPGPEHAPIDTIVRFEFSRPMAVGSVLRSFRIEPAVDGTLEWPDDRTLLFHPAAPLAYHSAYRVTVGGFPAAGGNLAALGSFTFATVWRPPSVPFPFTLTFDDCGTPEAIQAILSALADRQLHAIFFPTGQCRDQLPWLVPALLAAGHRVCNHTYSHPDLSRLSAAAIRSEIERGVSVGCDLFRPPYGAMDRSGRVASVAASLGYRIQLWDVDTRDWAGTPADVMVAMIRARGGVVLMHMHGLHTVEAIRAL